MTKANYASLNAQELFSSPLSRLAFYASVAATLVTIGLNASAAWDMRADIGAARAMLLALGSGALGALAPLAFLAAARSEGRSRTQALTAGAVLLIFNLSTAIGTAEHGRASLVTAHTEAENKSAEWARQRNEKNAALAKLQYARAAGELKPQIATLKMTPGANNCEKIDGRTSNKVCTLVADLESEIARGEARTELQNEIAVLNEKLARPPSADADPKAAAVSWLLGLLGISIAEDDAGRALSVLLAVALEIASAFGLTIAAALAVTPAPAPQRVRPQIVAAPAPANEDVTPPVAHAAAALRAATARQPATRASEVDAAVIAYLRRVGRVRETQRTTAERLELPKSSVGASLLRLRARGVVVQNVDGSLELAAERAVA